MNLPGPPRVEILRRDKARHAAVDWFALLDQIGLSHRVTVRRPTYRLQLRVRNERLPVQYRASAGASVRRS